MDIHAIRPHQSSHEVETLQNSAPFLLEKIVPIGPEH